MSVANLAAWQTRRADKRSNDALAARLARLESWQQKRYQAAVALAELIERRQLEIDNLRAQISEEISA